ncbi:phosphoenolpyruvate--protein phosphotransferase [bacterium]|nr:phosphoenolpyruvate--protein phosphotransferase [bacterium]
MEQKKEETPQSAIDSSSNDTDLSKATGPRSEEYPGRGKPVPRNQPFASAKLSGLSEHEGMVEGTVRIVPAFDDKWDKEEFADGPTTLEEQQKRLSIGFERSKNDLLVEFQATESELQKKGGEAGKSPSDIDQEIQTHKAIFESHLMITEDLYNKAQAFLSRSFISELPFTAEYAVYIVSKLAVATLQKQEEGSYAKARGGEIEDLRMSFQSNIVSPLAATPIPPGTILVGKRLSASHLKHALPKENILGFFTEEAAAHATDQAQTFGWAAITNVKGVTEKIKSGEIADGNHIFMDGDSGSIWLHTTSDWITEFYQEKGGRPATNTLVEIPSSYGLTRCREKPIQFSANILRPEELADIHKVWPSGAGAVGLFRTEEVITARHLEYSEEGQFRLYQPVVEASHRAAPIFRLIDWGGEKSETGNSQGNPELEDRGIRHSLLNEETRAVLRIQLRALLRASEQGPVAILVPMVTHAAELREFKKELSRARNELAEQSIFPPVEHISIGSMIETPAAVRGVQHILEEVQFVNIGSSDLTQYMLAASRGYTPDAKGEWTKQFGPHHPVVLEAIHDIIEAGHANGKQVHGCGKMFSKDFFAPLAVGLNLDSISLPPRTASVVYEELARLDYVACQAFVGWAAQESRGNPVLVHDELERFHDCVSKGTLWEPPRAEPLEPEPLSIQV